MRHLRGDRVAQHQQRNREGAALLLFVLAQSNHLQSPHTINLVPTFWLEAMSVIEELRQAETSIHILLRRETDADLARALEQNPFVTEVTLGLGVAAHQTDWDSLLRVIATRANLEKVTLQDTADPEERSAPAGLVRAFLRAIQQNTAIRSVEMCWLRLSTDISTFVDNASSITSYRLFECDMQPVEREQGTSALVAALQRNTNIKTLELWDLDDLYAIPILEGLRLHTSLKTLNFAPAHFSGELSLAIQHLLESTTSIQRFELQEEAFSDEQLFRPIAQGIINSECVSELKFSWIRFQDRENVAQLQSILQNKRNLTSLCFEYCDFFAEGQVHENIISMLSRPDSVLQCFKFQSNRWSLETVFPRIPFETLLRAIEKSKLERFSIGLIETQQQLQTLKQSIPSVKLEELEVVCIEEPEGGLDRETIKQGLLQAVKNNFSLRTVKGEIEHHHDLFESAEDKQTLAFYANRNKSLDQWVDHPETVKPKVWPDVLSLAERAGPSALFRGLRSVLGRDYVSLPGRKESKHPQAMLLHSRLHYGGG